LRLGARWLPTNTVLGLLGQIIFSGSIAMFIYCFLAWALGFKEPILLWRQCLLFIKRFQRKSL